MPFTSNFVVSRGWQEEATKENTVVTKGDLKEIIEELEGVIAEGRALSQTFSTYVEQLRLLWLPSTPVVEEQLPLVTHSS